MPEVLPATIEDKAEVCEFLHRHMAPDVSVERFGNLFDYPWLAQKPDHGFVLREAGRLVGYIGTIYADRPAGGRVERFCNLSSWFVLPEFRNHSLKLLMACQKDREVTYTNLSARPVVQKIHEALRYRRLGRYKLFTPPLAQLWPALWRRPRGLGFITDPSRIRDLLPDSDRTIFDHHLPTQCRHMLIEEGSRSCYVVWNRRIKKMVPFSEILYLSDRQLFRRHWESAKLRILWRDRTPSLAIDEHVLGGEPPKMFLRYERITMFKSPRLEPAQIDNLYSELALL